MLVAFRDDRVVYLTDIREQDDVEGMWLAENRQRYGKQEDLRRVTGVTAEYVAKWVQRESS